MTSMTKDGYIDQTIQAVERGDADTVFQMSLEWMARGWPISELRQYMIPEDISEAVNQAIDAYQEYPVVL